MSYISIASGTYYIACSSWIYFNVAPWCTRPRTATASRTKEEESLIDNENKKQTSRRLSLFARLGPPRGSDENPFFSDCWYLSQNARLSMALLGPILFPIRFVGVALSMIAAVMLSSIIVAGIPHKHFECGSTRPLSAWRRALRIPLRLLGRTLLFFLGYIYIEEEGRPAPTKEAPIVVSNHLGPVEPIVLAVMTGGMPVSKLENASLPLFGALAKAFLPIFVDRTNSNSRQLVKDEIEFRAKSVMIGDFRTPVFLFPEGTTTNGTSVITFKSGAFNPRLPVQPVVVEFPHSEGTFFPSWVAASPSLPELAIRMLCQPYNRCKIKWLPKMDPLEEEMTEWPGPKLFASRVQHKVAEALGSPTTQYAFEDVRLMKEATKIGGKRGALATGGAAIEFKLLQEFVDININDALKYLNKFNSLAKTSDGELTFEEFKQAFGEKMGTGTIRQLFDLLDDDCSGRLNFREFLVGASLTRATSEKSVDEALKLSFRIFDLKNEGSMSFQTARNILKVIHPNESVEKLQKTFQEMDENGDGLLDQDEFVRWAKLQDDALSKIKGSLL